MHKMDFVLHFLVYNFTNLENTNTWKETGNATQ